MFSLHTSRRHFPRPANPLPFHPRMSFIILSRLKLWKICTSKLHLLNSRFTFSFMAGCGGRNLKHYCNYQSALQTRVTTWSWSFSCLEMWPYLGNHRLSLHITVGFPLAFMKLQSWGTHIATFMITSGPFRPSHLVWGSRCLWADWGDPTNVSHQRWWGRTQGQPGLI